MIEVGRGPAAPPKIPRGGKNEGRTYRVSSERAFPKKASHSGPFKGRGCLQRGEGRSSDCQKSPQVPSELLNHHPVPPPRNPRKRVSSEE